MLIPQDFSGDGVGERESEARAQSRPAATPPTGAASDQYRAHLWDRIVQVHFLAEDLLHPDLAPHVTEPMTRFVSAVLKEWAVQAEEGLRRAGGQGASPAG